MIKNPKVFVCDDWNLADNLDEIAEGLRVHGVNVVRGPKSLKGSKIVYSQEDYKLFEDADVALFSSRSVCDKKVIEACKKLKGIVVPSIGTDTIDMNYCGEQGIVVGNGSVPENYMCVVEDNIMHMLMSVRKPWLSLEVTAGKIEKPSQKDMWIRMFNGMTVGLIGLGRIGNLVAKRLDAFGVKVLGYDPYIPLERFPDFVVHCETLEEMLPQVDILALYVVINESTKNIINKDTLSKMKSSAYLINTSRPQAVNEDDLYNALKDGVISGATLDVTDIEPLPMDSKLRELDNILIYPHVAGYSRSYYEAMTKTGIENILNILNGEPPKYIVNPKVLGLWEKKFSSEYKERLS